MDRSPAQTAAAVLDTAPQVPPDMWVGPRAIMYALAGCGIDSGGPGHEPRLADLADTARALALLMLEQHRHEAAHQFTMAANSLEQAARQRAMDTASAHNSADARMRDALGAILRAHDARRFSRVPECAGTGCLPAGGGRPALTGP